MATGRKLTDETATTVKPQDQAAASEPAKSGEKKQDQATDTSKKESEKPATKPETKIESEKPESTGDEAEQKDKVDTKTETIGDAVPQDKAGEVSELEKAQGQGGIDPETDEDRAKNAGAASSHKQPGKRGAGLHHR